MKVGLNDRRSVGQRRHQLRSSLVAGGMHVVYDMTNGSHARRVFDEKVLELGYTELSKSEWPCEERLKLTAGDIYHDGDATVLQAEGMVALVAMNWGTCSVRIAAETEERRLEAMSAFQQAYPATYLSIEEDGETRIPISFWTLGPFGPVSRMRMISAGTWEEVAPNYPGEVRDQLHDLMSFEPGRTGQLILWQGPPGTGKTWALRALAHEWRSWAEFHYITDPDAFFVDSSIYMVDVLLSESVMAVEEASGDVYDTQDPEGKWRVLILEDTGELLSANAKEKYGQGLSRLLNVVDGMIGQGLRVLVVVTTNDELGDLNPAVQRPGRCASKIEFRAMTEEESSEWLGGDAEEAKTIAELYASDRELTAAAAEVGESIVEQVRKVAEAHRGEAVGYGECAYDATTGTVLYVCGDWTDPEPVEKDMRAIDGVEDFVYDFEAMPDGWCNAEIVYPEITNDQHWLVAPCRDAPDQESAKVLALATRELETRKATPEDFADWRERSWEGS